MSEPRGSRILTAVLLVVIIGVVFFGLWAFASMVLEDGAQNGPVLFAVGAILLGTVAMAAALWLIRHVASRTTSGHSPAPTGADSEPPAA